ncbi:MAG: peptidoglycan DD-metalloendopeptidase family protein [Patescibacteria group bacterium]|nr:peptidoglycan DD-metalloendopeptidase family protein [Patescibacteria group bacterium]MDE1943943.1 peptidoglycan DD-metalloendopeptidase family protein [Patescibacteria group bacterium]MDE1945024.1 peptidoglycan DD-metalloendopeptidase family protein [Patescibacteria group bacterium]MDE2057530.1 peptidoglycan DD-metalloendopeptidase family protein [Patescibacteria group bacterium]
MMTRSVFFAAVLALTAGAAGAYLFAYPALVKADAASDIQSQIDAHNSQIAQLEADIAAYQKQLDALAAEKKTLNSALAGFTVTAKQLATQIRATQNKIAAAELQIESLNGSITEKQSEIAAEQDAIAKMLRAINENESVPLVAALISSESLSAAWQTADQAVELNRALSKNIDALRGAQVALAADRDQVASQKNQLAALSSDLATQKQGVDANAASEKQLINQTSNKEASYQQLIAAKKAAETQFESELNQLQSQLNLIVNPGSLPAVGTGVLSWPFSVAFMTSCAARAGTFGNKFCITQYFGNTPFSTKNPQIYNGHGHNAIDIAAPIGTPVHAALAGTVLGVGNTDLSHNSKGQQCYSFGKWVMIKHGNGLNTMYAHLSQIEVAQGQAVETGQVIGLSGMTGYATGPHLHFGVYATDGTEIMDLGAHLGTTDGPCSKAVMPVATLAAYLNPLSYL